MANEKTYSNFEEFSELTDDATEVETTSWRHGTRKTVVIHDDDGDWLVTYDLHSEEGLQWYGSVTGRRAEKYMKTIEVWRAVQ